MAYTGSISIDTVRVCERGPVGSENSTMNNWRLSIEEDHADGSLALQESKPELKRPPLFKVVLINDDYTPMEFVVEVLEVFFRMNREQATHVMLTVHTQGKGDIVTGVCMYMFVGFGKLPHSQITKGDVPNEQD